MKKRKVENSFIKPQPNVSRKIETIYYPTLRGPADMKTFIDALQYAEQINPLRYKLIELYDQSIDYDSHLKATIASRRRLVANKEIEFVDSNGEQVEAMKEFCSSPKFYQFIADIFMARMYGFSVFEFLNPSSDFDYELKDRRNCDMVNRKIYVNKWGGDGVNWLTDTEKAKYLMAVGRHDDLGELCSVMPAVIKKRNGDNDWASYVELAGINFMVTKTTSTDPRITAQLQAATKNMGAGARLNLPEGVDVEFDNLSSSQQNDLFKTFHDTWNAEISKALLGQTMTMENGSSRSQAEVHERMQDIVFDEDERYVLSVLNYQFSNYLTLWGLKVQGRFCYKHETTVRSLEVEKERIAAKQAKCNLYLPLYEKGLITLDTLMQKIDIDD